MNTTSGLLLEIRDRPAQAIKERGWDPVSWAVDTKKNLEERRSYFVAAGVPCSRIFTAVKGWVLCAEDPDERSGRNISYTLEEHEMMTEKDHDAYWLGN